MLHNWEFSAKNIIAHFQAACKGCVPFSRNWLNQGNISAAALDANSIAFMSQLIDLVTKERQYCFPLIRLSFIPQQKDTN
jgi:hypothetical protein